MKSISFKTGVSVLLATGLSFAGVAHPRVTIVVAPLG
jgi:hypothetical protein